MAAPGESGKSDALISTNNIMGICRVRFIICSYSIGKRLHYHSPPKIRICWEFNSITTFTIFHHLLNWWSICVATCSNSLSGGWAVVVLPLSVPRRLCSPRWTRSTAASASTPTKEYSVKQLEPNTSGMRERATAKTYLDDGLSDLLGDRLCDRLQISIYEDSFLWRPDVLAHECKSSYLLLQSSSLPWPTNSGVHGSSGNCDCSPPSPIKSPLPCCKTPWRNLWRGKL